MRESLAARLAEKLARKKSERFTYLVAAVMSSLGITSMAVMAVYYRFSWQMEGGEVPFSEMFGTFALSFGAAVGMEFWARWAHRALWHASFMAHARVTP
ncbi:Phospholipase A2 crotoxin acid subunit CA [Datura stramonium]|uniref:beta-carotene 3-hydroxylase n=1 Tax=Datura stramonium TaxID=4076 RepID=A0ABS8W2G1_DATST|nr:Phospholipase A2 crotoxin acid subunit CA [Datura stramonium]